MAPTGLSSAVEALTLMASKSVSVIRAPGLNAIDWAQTNRPAAAGLAANDNRLSPLSRTKLGPMSRVAHRRANCPVHRIPFCAAIFRLVHDWAYPGRSAALARRFPHDRFGRWV